MSHSWGEKLRFQFKSEAECTKCGLVKVSRHEHEGGRDRRWTEYWRGGEQLDTTKLPACEPIGEGVT